MESEGPYKWVKQSMWDYPTISGPGIDGNKEIIGLKEFFEMINFSYAEGRKSMEKDFKELLELANNLADVAADDVTPFPEIRKFDAWKKARGIK